jgi:MFS family permease
MSNQTVEANGPQRDSSLQLGVERNVLVLSGTSFLTDASNNMVFPLIALFLDNVLGVQPALIGLVQGVVESAASLLKMFSGWLSDRMGRRKALIVAGYWTSTVAKAFLAIAGSWWFVLLTRLVDRTGKGLRAAPAQAMVADASPKRKVGRAFGFYKMMDVAGAMAGLLASAGIIYLVQGDQRLLEQRTFQRLVLAGLVPAVLGALLVLLFLTERKGRAAGAPAAGGTGWRALDVRFKIYLGIISIFTLGHFSDAFLTLRAQELGAPALQVVLLLVAFRAVYSLVSVPAGALSDRFGRKPILVSGWVLCALVYLGLALASQGWQIWVLFLLYGLYLGSTKGVERALVADLVPAARSRGTAYGAFNATVGLTALPASLLAGVLWQTVAPGAAFLAGAALALVAAGLLVALIH